MSLILNSNSDDEPLYSDSVFSTYLYTGNGSTQTITNGIDLAGKGGMVWIKNRSAANNHRIYDTSRVLSTADGILSSTLYPNLTNSSSVFDGDVGLLSNGFKLRWSSAEVNAVSNTYTAWTFRKAPKFFDVVTYTGNGVDGRTIAHSLGIVPGMIIVKRTDTTSNWITSNRVGTSNYVNLWLNATNAANPGFAAGGIYTPQDSNKTNFSVNAGADVNASGGTYVAYLFAHDTSSTGIIQCGSYTSNGSSIDVNLGWEPQFVLVKEISTAGRDWCIIDNMRGMMAAPAANSGPILFPNTSGAELGASSTSGPAITSTGFNVIYSSSNFNYPSGKTYIYMAIRRPNKPPTTGTQVYNAVARTGTGAAATVTGVGFPPDLIIPFSKDAANRFVFDRLRGNSKGLKLGDTQVEYDSSSSAPVNFEQNGFSCSTDSFNICNTSTAPFINWFFKRAPGFMDVVCYTGTGTTPLTINHSLGVVPEFIITKNRTGTGYQSTWYCYHAYLSSPLNKSPALNESAAIGANSDAWRNITSTTFAFGSGLQGFGNVSGVNGVSYLFATLAGISKVGSYTGNGSSQNIECGFAAGARFVLIKRTDSTGDWYVWDTTRGIVSANDPHLSLNTTAAEVTTDDSVDPYSAGFAVNQVAATNINVTSATYIFLAIS